MRYVLVDGSVRVVPATPTVTRFHMHLDVGTDGKCVHCDRIVTADHDPAECACCLAVAPARETRP